MNSRRVTGFNKFWIKVTRWEFWLFQLLYFPVYFYYVWLAIRHRSLFFFTASNPTIEFGGMMGEKKSDIYSLLPSACLPEMKLFTPGSEKEALEFAARLGFPVIVKPNIGERGRMVEKITSPEEIKRYLPRCSVDFFVQEFIDYPVELAIFYIRHPDNGAGKVTSLVQKDFLKVKGDGKSEVKKLLETNVRAVLQVDLSNSRFQQVLSEVPAMDQEVLIEPIGNHSRGTTFLNLNHCIDPSLHDTIDRLAKTIPGFYFGRFDVKCKSLDELKKGEGFKVIELNGAGAEPVHIYHPGYPLFAAYRDILWHLKVLAQISRKNHLRGHPYWSFSRGMKKMLEIRKYNKMITLK